MMGWEVDHRYRDGFLALGPAAVPAMVRAYNRRPLKEREKTQPGGPGWVQLNADEEHARAEVIRAHLLLIDGAQLFKACAGEPLLLTAAEDLDPRTVGLAFFSLVQGHCPATRAVLLKALGGDHCRQNAAVAALQDLGDAATVGPLLALLEQPDREASRCVPQENPTMDLAKHLANKPETETLHEKIAKAIDAITKRDFAGDVPKIRAWLREAGKAR